MSYAGPRFRQGIKLTSRGVNSLLVRQYGNGTRPLSTLLSTNHRSCLVQVSLASRNFSLWPSKTSPTSTPSSPPPPPENIAEKPNEAEFLSGTPPVEPTTNATTAEATSTIAEPSFAPEPTSILDSGTTITDILNNIPVPLQYGDFEALGLAGWTPAGIIRWSYEILNVSSGLPWFWTIVVGSALWRFVCVPLTIKAMRTSAILQPHRKELEAMQERLKQNTTTRNPAAYAKANREMQEFYGKLGVTPFGSMVGLLQLPVTFGMFFGVKKMCELPVEQLKYSGFELFPDLTLADPTWILPFVMTVAINAQFIFGARDVAPQMRKIMYFFNILSIPGFFILKGLPAGLILSMLTTAVLTTAQTIIMRIPRVRRALRMPAYVHPPKVGGQSFFAELRTLMSKDGDIKVKVARARREETRKRTLQGTPKGQ